MSEEHRRAESRRMNRCGNCELYAASAGTQGSCEFWKSMDVMPVWMEGENIPTHAVKHDDGEHCEAFIPQQHDTGGRQNWLFNNLTSRN